MTSNRLESLAIRAYPADIRIARGAEMVDTLRDIRTATPERYGAELVDLLRLGMRMRAVRRLSDGVARLVADGLCVGAILIAVLELSDLVSHYLRGVRGTLESPVMAISLALILAAALVGFDRPAGVAAMIWLLVRMPELYQAKGSVIGALPSLVPLACFATMAAAPRGSKADWRRLGWLLAPALLIATFGPARPNPALLVVVGLAAVAVVATAVFLVPVDPRFAIACAAPAAYLGLQIVWKAQAPIVLSTVFLSVLPAVLVYAFVRSRHRHDVRI